MMAKKTAAEVSADKLQLFEKLVATNPRVELKGATMPYTSMNGHMFCFLTKAGTLALRLPADEREAFLRKYKTQLCVQHGRVMQEYVDVPDALFKQTRELQAYFNSSVAYVGSLKPKPTTRKKKTAKKKATKKKTARKPAKKKRAR